MMVVLGGGLVIEGRFVILLNTICLRPESEILCTHDVMFRVRIQTRTGHEWLLVLEWVRVTVVVPNIASIYLSSTDA